MIVNRALKICAAVYLVVLMLAVMSYKAAFIDVMFNNLFFGIYSVCGGQLHHQPLHLQPLLPVQSPMPGSSRRSRS